MSFRQASPEKQKAHAEKLAVLWAAYKTSDGATSALKEYNVLYNTCPECGGTDTRMENYSAMWHEADIVCNKCHTFVRSWDAG